MDRGALKTRMAADLCMARLGSTWDGTVDWMRQAYLEDAESMADGVVDFVAEWLEPIGTRRGDHTIADAWREDMGA